jgi:hypothetical protein
MKFRFLNWSIHCHLTHLRHPLISAALTIASCFIIVNKKQKTWLGCLSISFSALRYTFMTWWQINIQKSKVTTKAVYVLKVILVGVTELLVGDTVVNIGKEREEHEEYW